MQAVVTITGFTESLAKPTGLEAIFWTVLRRHTAPAMLIHSPLAWSSEMRGVAAFLVRGGVRELMLVAYSWGAGVGAVALARECQRIGIEIPIACLCDPVHRSSLLPSWIPLNPYSLLPMARIKIPPSIRNVRWVRQKQSIPSGHTPVAEDESRTNIYAAITLRTTHSKIDDSHEFREIVAAEFQKFQNSAYTR